MRFAIMPACDRSIDRGNKRKMPVPAATPSSAAERHGNIVKNTPVGCERFFIRARPGFESVCRLIETQFR
jgi:hypothetical protein